jgi:DNA (cytosine-5)-methyltransferase 1
MSIAYYNEIDPYCAAWLHNLMDAGHIAPGVIDTRSIEDVRPDELSGYTQCHFFAGLGGWAYALDLAGWPRDRPVWTGSCPCQPFSAAGKGHGFADERHLWPVWQHLIAQRRPPVVFGEQVTKATQWIGLVCGDLEAMDYAVGFNHIEAASKGADHLRDRCWFVADTCGTGLAQRERERGVLSEVGCESQGQDATNDGRALGHAYGIIGGQGCALDGRRDQGSSALPGSGLSSAVGRSVMAYADQLGASEGRQQRSGQLGGIGGDPQTRHGWIIGHDGKARRVEPGIRLLAHGVSGRMALVRTDEQTGAEISHWYSRIGALRGLGNAIDSRPAQAFIESYCEARGLIGLAEAA